MTSHQPPSHQKSQDDDPFDDHPADDNVVADAQTTSSSSTILRKRKQEDENNNNNNYMEWDTTTGTEEDHDAQGALVYPTSVFAHIPGTSPPIPPFPLDSVGIVFGPVDRYAKFYHLVKLDEASYKLVMSTLLARLSRTHPENDKEEREGIQKQLQELAEEYVDLHASNVYKRMAICSRGKLRDLPLVQYYRGMMGYCSFVANGCSTLNSAAEKESSTTTTIKEEPIHFDDDDDDLYGDSDDDKNNKDKDSGGIVQTMADQISAFCEKRIKHNGLLRFPRLRVTYALAVVCRKLPNSAAEILSMPIMDEGSYENATTPLQIIQRTLEHLESHHMIDGGETHDQEENVIRAGELEYLMYDAAEIFQECVKLDSINVDYHLWHIGALAACLLLCSGNRIGSEARCFPSSRKKRSVSYLHEKHLDHEVRHQLPKFHDSRLELAASVRMLFTLAHHQQGPRVHLAISSLLEWKQVVALLAGDSLQDDSILEEIKGLHKFHVYQRASQDNSSSAREYMKGRLELSDDLSRLALELENDPANIENWRRLAGALGPFGYDSSQASDETSQTHRNECPECRCLRAPRIFDHEAESKNKSNPSWWGAQREWWVSDLFHLDSVESWGNRRTNKTSAEKVVRKLEEQMSDVVPESSVPGAAASVTVQSRDLEWLPNRESLLADGDADKTVEELSLSHDSELPKSPHEMPQQSIDFTESSIPIPDLSGPNAERLGVLCYKILIFAHLQQQKGWSINPLLTANIYALMSANYDGRRIKDEGDEFRSLLWLCSVGLDVPYITRETFSHGTTPTASSTPHVTPNKYIQTQVTAWTAGRVGNNNIAMSNTMAE